MFWVFAPVILPIPTCPSQIMHQFQWRLDLDSLLLWMQLSPGSIKSFFMTSKMNYGQWAQLSQGTASLLFPSSQLGLFQMTSQIHVGGHWPFLKAQVFVRGWHIILMGYLLPLCSSVALWQRCETKKALKLSAVWPMLIKSTRKTKAIVSVP